MDGGGGFAGLVALHQRLVRDDDVDQVSGSLYPREPSVLERWRPTFAWETYRAVDPSGLGLGGVDSFHGPGDGQLRAAVLRVIEVEGPVHFDLLGDRLLDAAGVGRMGSRIRERIESTLAVLADEGTIERLASFNGYRAQFLRPRWRDWSGLPDRDRRLEYVAGSELMLCLFHAVLDRDGVDAETALNDGIHAIGFVRLTGNARERLQGPLEALLERGMLRRVGDGLAVGLEAFVR